MTRADIEEALGPFFAALNALDLDAFLATWGASPTAILPAPHLPRRYTGREEVRAGFAALFEAMRASSTADGPPYLDLVPVDLDVQELSDAVALVTFHLDLGAAFGRRTLVLSRDDGGSWRVRHLHGSNLPRG